MPWSGITAQGISATDAQAIGQRVVLAIAVDVERAQRLDHWLQRRGTGFWRTTTTPPLVAALKLLAASPGEQIAVKVEKDPARVVGVLWRVFSTSDRGK